MDAVHEGGCLCGAIRFAVTGPPIRTSVCHCADCRRRSGSAFAILPFFEASAVRFIRGTPATWRHVSDESGRWLENSVCPRCGTPIGLRVERLADRQGICGGAFDDPAWFVVDRHIWTRSKLPWVAVPEGCEVLEKG